MMKTSIIRLLRYIVLTGLITLICAEWNDIPAVVGQSPSNQQQDFSHEDYVDYDKKTKREKKQFLKTLSKADQKEFKMNFKKWQKTKIRYESYQSELNDGLKYLEQGQYHR